MAGVARRRPRSAVTSTSWDQSRGYRPEARTADDVRTAHNGQGALPESSGIVGGSWKRSFDILAAICAIVLLSPLYLMIAASIKLGDAGPVLFRHRRIGRSGKPFYCLKFRTMAVDAESLLERHLALNPEAAREWAADHKLRQDPRVTPLGHGLRKTSLDELPQLVNILKGEMSFVGPRPIVSAEVPKYGDAIHQYCCARPGLTGPWQVSGRNDVDYAQRVMFDTEYVEHWNFWRDVAIIGKTFRVVVTRKGCY